MTAPRRLAVGAFLAGFVILVMSSAAEAALEITTPSTLDLGAVPSGTATRSAQMGTVTVRASGLVAPSYVVTVTSTGFTSGGGTPGETIPKASISYWSGPVTASTGLQTAVPGQLNATLAQDLSVPRIAFSSAGLALSITTSWRPTIVVNVPPAAVAGAYTGTITHSVA